MILQVIYTNNFMILVKIDKVLAKMQQDDKAPKCGSIHSSFRSSSLKIKKVNTSTSTIDQSAQINFNIDFEKRMDNFADLHKNIRILLK